VVAAEIDWLGAFEEFGSLARPANVAGTAFCCRLDEAGALLFRAGFPSAFSEFSEGYFVCFSELGHTRIVVISIRPLNQIVVDSYLTVPSQWVGRFRQRLQESFVCLPSRRSRALGN